MSQPVELITATTAHEIVEKLNESGDTADKILGLIERVGGKEQRQKGEQEIKCKAAELFAERLLCQIAHNAAPHIIRKALAALGCPHEDDEIWGRIEAAREAQKREAEGAPAVN
jgi:hypothetical protein